jgi:hypothetical protein
VQYEHTLPRRLDTEAILNDLSASKVSASLAWLADGGIEVKLGDAVNGFQAEAKVGTLTEVAEWLRSKVLMCISSALSWRRSFPAGAAAVASFVSVSASIRRNAQESGIVAWLR